MNIMKYLTSWKYRHFIKKVYGVDKTIEDYTFKRFKLMELREEIRQELTLNNSRLEVLQNTIKAQKDKPTMEKGEIARMDDDEVRLKNKVEE